MGKEKVNPGEKVASGMNMGANEADSDHSVGAPRFMADFECVGPDGVIKWSNRWKNAVVNQGKIDLMNMYLGRTGGAGNTWYLGLHNSTNTNVTHQLSNITASEITGYSGNVNNSRWTMSFASTYTTNSATQTASYGMTAAVTTTVGGAFVCNQGVTNGTTGTLYSEGNFAAGTRQFQQNDTLNVTLTLSFA